MNKTKLLLMTFATALRYIIPTALLTSLVWACCLYNTGVKEIDRDVHIDNLFSRKTNIYITYRCYFPNKTAIDVCFGNGDIFCIDKIETKTNQIYWK
jgi:hypothetical protein